MLAGALGVRDAKKVSCHLLPLVFQFGHQRGGGLPRPVSPAGSWVSNTPIEACGGEAAMPALPRLPCVPDLIVVTQQLKISLLPPGPNRLF